LRPTLAAVQSRVYLDWETIPPGLRVDCQVEVWKIHTDPTGQVISHTNDGQLVTSPLILFDGTPEQFLAELSEVLALPLAAKAASASTQVLLDEMDRYLTFSALLSDADAALVALRIPAQTLDDATLSRTAFLGDDLNHGVRSQLLSELNARINAARAIQSQLVAMIAAEPSPPLKACCQSRFDHFDRSLDSELVRADKLAHSAAEPPRRRPVPPQR
jgi:hypothetical protein